MGNHPQPQPELPPARRWVALPFLLVGSFLSIFDQFVINVAAVPIGRSLHADAGQLEAIVSGYALVYALGLISGGRLGDNFGRRLLYRTGLLCFAVTSLVCALAQTADELIAARLLQGASGALLLPQVLALIRTQFPDHERPKALSWFGVTLGIGQIGGQLLGGAIPAWDLFGLAWRPIFVVNIPLCLTAFVVCGRLVTDTGPTGPRTSLDAAGVLLLAAATTALLVPLLGARRILWWPWGTALIAAAVILVACFARRQPALTCAGRNPLVNTTLFRSPAFNLDE